MPLFKKTALLMTFLLIVSSFVVLAEEPAPWRCFYVSPSGDAAGDGSEAHPFGSIEAAQAAVRSVSKEMEGDILVKILPGTYYLADTLQFHKQDSGQNGYRIIWEGVEMPVISGGIPVTDFTESAEHPGLWEAYLPEADYVGNFSVNGKMANIAAADRRITGTATYDDPATPMYDFDGMYVLKNDIGFWENAEDIELQWVREWKFSTAKVESIFQDPENADQVILKMRQGWWNRMSSFASTELTPRYNQPFLVTNALELLDMPGEYYFNRHTKTLYYMPREGEALETATGIAAQLDFILRIDGQDERVKNVSFRGLHFSNATYTAADSEAILNNQATSYWGTSGLQNSNVTGAVEVNRAEGIEFVGNHFSEMKANGLVLFNGVFDSRVEGNVFSDIGFAALQSGWARHHNSELANGTHSEVPTDMTAPVELNDGYTTEIYFSYIDRNLSLHNANTDSVERTSWHGDPLAAEKGERQWVLYDMMEKYHLTEIKLGFASTITAEERSGYEVLLSNDRDFKEFVQVAVQNEPAAECESYYPDPSGEAYRYVLIRQLNPGPFALSTAFLYTKDIKPMIKIERNKNIRIANNYIRRSGYYAPSCGMALYYADNQETVHNEVISTGYTGIATGFSWTNVAPGQFGGGLRYNLIEDACKLIFDGGGFYNCGRMADFDVEYNFVKSVDYSWGAYYLDSGSGGIRMRNNVALNTVCAQLASWVSSFGRDRDMVDVVLENNYYPHDIRYSGVTRDGMVLYNPLEPPEAVRRIMEEAGLEPEWEYLRGWVSDDDIFSYPENRDIYGHSPIASYLPKMLENVLITMQEETTHYGFLPGQVPYSVRYELKELESLLEKAKTTSDKAEKRELLIYIREALFALVEQVQQPTLEELLAICEEGLQSATAGTALGTYPEAAIAALRKATETASQGGDTFQKREALIQAYATFMGSKNCVDLEYVYAEGALSSNIDLESKTVTLYFPEETNPIGAKLEFYPAPGASLAELSSAVYRPGLSIPVRSTSSKDYAIWRVVTETVSRASESGFTDVIAENNVVYRDSAGNSYIRSRLAPVMCKTAAEPGVLQEVTFVPQAASLSQRFDLIFNAACCEGFLPSEHSHFLLSVDGKNGTLYSVVGGQRTMLAEVRLPFNAGAENTLGVRVSKNADGVQAILYLNGRCAAHVVTDKIGYIDGYMGFCGETVSFKIIS